MKKACKASNYFYFSEDTTVPNNFKTTKDWDNFFVVIGFQLGYEPNSQPLVYCYVIFSF